MAKKYSGGIRTATGFKRLSPEPIEDSMVVETENDLYDLDNTYGGQKVFVEDVNCEFILLDGWQKITNTVKYITVSVPENITVHQAVINSAEFSISANQTVLVQAFTMAGSTITKKKIYQLVGVGIGNYGGGQANLSKLNFLLISEKDFAFSDIENDPDTQKVYFEVEEDEYSVADLVNAQVEPIEFQSQADGYRIVVVTTPSGIATYLFSGEEGTYGEDVEYKKAVDSEFEPLQENLPKVLPYKKFVAVFGNTDFGEGSVPTILEYENEIGPFEMTLNEYGDCSFDFFGATTGNNKPLYVQWSCQHNDTYMATEIVVNGFGFTVRTTRAGEGIVSGGIYAMSIEARVYPL